MTHRIMTHRIMVIDDTETILRVKAEKLRAAGYEVLMHTSVPDALEVYSGAFDPYARDLRGKHPYAIITDTDIRPVFGPALITYLSPRTNRSNKMILSGSHEASDIKHYRASRICNRVAEVEGLYLGKLILTSHQDLKPMEIPEKMVIEGRQEISVFNEALRIADAVFKIGEDGSGIDKLIEFLKA